MITPVSNQFTKEAIKARMMQNAANLWGVKNPASLDPFVRLLIEAFSIEIYRAANESQNIEGRILDKIARLLTPNLLTMPHAAHGILHAMPVERSQEIHPTLHFYTEKKLTTRENGPLDQKVDITFTPVLPAKLVKARVTYIATASQLFRIDEQANKVPLMRTTKPLPWATCYLGIETGGGLNNLEGAALYFDFPSYQAQQWVYQLLPLCKLFLEKEITLSQGLSLQENIRTEAVGDSAIFRDYDLMYQITRDISNIYNNKFLTLGSAPLPADSSFPQAFTEAFDAEYLKSRIEKKVVWLELKFPSNYTYEILDNIYVSLNAFPVLNRSLIDTTYSYKALNNILPLRHQSHERFMTVHRVSDGHDRTFSEIPFNRSGENGYGYYSLRHGGAERFDERSAQDMVNYLLELTRDEVAAFSSLNQDFIFNTLQDISRQLKLLQNKAEKIEVNIRQVPTYLIAEPFDDDDSLQVTYWVTQSELGNGIRSGTTMLVKGSSDIEVGSAVLLTESRGGRETLQPGERLDAYRYVLGSRDRLITNEDIRNFCRHELGSRLKEVKFSKGLALSPHPKQGYVRTLDVILLPQRFAEFELTEWEYIAQNLLSRIQANSPDGIHYRVLVSQEG